MFGTGGTLAPMAARCKRLQRSADHAAGAAPCAGFDAIVSGLRIEGEVVGSSGRVRRAWGELAALCAENSRHRAGGAGAPERYATEAAREHPPCKRLQREPA